MDAPRPALADVWAARVVAWHNRHPLAQRITPAQVSAMGWVDLPFAPPAARAGQNDTAERERWKPVFSERFLPALSLKAIARWALRHGRATPPQDDDAPVRRVPIDQALLPAGAHAMVLWLATAAVQVRGRQQRVLLGGVAPFPVMGRRLLSPLRSLVAALLVGALVATSVLAWRGLQQRATAGGAAAHAGAAAGYAASAASAASAVLVASAASAVPAAAPAAAGASAAAAMHADANAHANAHAGTHTNTPAGAAASPPAAQPPTPSPALTAPVAAAASAATVPHAAPQAAPQAAGASAPPVVAAKASAAGTGASAAAQAHAPAHAHAPPQAPEDAPDTAASGAGRRAAPFPPRRPVLDEATKLAAQRELAAAKAARASAKGQPVYAVVTRRVRTRVDADTDGAHLSSALANVETPRGLRVEALPAGAGWQAICWPFLKREDAEKVRDELAPRGLKIEVVAF